MKARILIVDDDRTLREGYGAFFCGLGYDVEMASSVASARTAIAVSHPDLIILDLTLGDGSGFTVLEEIRSNDRLVPVIVLTSFDCELNRVHSLSLAADDCISKGASLEELSARVARALARVSDYRNQHPGNAFALGRTQVDLVRRVVTLPDGTTTSLRATEANILRVLRENPNRTLSIQDLTAALHGEGYVIESSTLRSQISRLRGKLGSAGELIVGDRGVGYRLVV